MSENIRYERIPTIWYDMPILLLYILTSPPSRDTSSSPPLLVYSRRVSRESRDEIIDMRIVHMMWVWYERYHTSISCTADAVSIYYSLTSSPSSSWVTMPPPPPFTELPLDWVVGVCCWDVGFSFIANLWFFLLAILLGRDFKEECVSDVVSNQAVKVHWDKAIVIGIYLI